MAASSSSHQEEMGDAARKSAYKPPALFKLVDLPPLVENAASESTELWLIRISDSQLAPDDFKNKKVTMRLRSASGKLGRFQGGNGNLYDIVALKQTESVQPFAFLPNSNGTSLDVRRVSRQVSFVRSLDSEIESVTVNVPTGKKNNVLGKKDAKLQLVRSSTVKKELDEGIQKDRKLAVGGTPDSSSEAKLSETMLIKNFTMGGNIDESMLENQQDNQRVPAVQLDEHFMEKHIKLTNGVNLCTKSLNRKERITENNAVALRKKSRKQKKVE